MNLPQFFHTQKEALTRQPAEGAWDDEHQGLGQGLRPADAGGALPPDRGRDGRGDDAERERLAKSAGRITISISDHAPYGLAFSELAIMIFAELLEEAARYHDALRRAGDADELDAAVEAEAEESDRTEEGEDDEGEEESAAAADAEPAETDARSYSERMWDLALFAGFVLRRKAEG